MNPTHQCTRTTVHHAPCRRGRHRLTSGPTLADDEGTLPWLEPDYPLPRYRALAHQEPCAPAHPRTSVIVRDAPVPPRASSSSRVPPRSPAMRGRSRGSSLTMPPLTRTRALAHQCTRSLSCTTRQCRRGVIELTSGATLAVDEESGPVVRALRVGAHERAGAWDC